MLLRSRVSEIISSKPGLSASEIAEAIYGLRSHSAQVSRTCRELIREGLVLRTGTGGPRSEFTFAWNDEECLGV